MPNHQEIHYIGRVLDKEKQAPLSGAKITIHVPGSSVIVYSDLEGIYKFKVPFDDNSVVEGEITIEATGYKSYYSFIRLLPSQRDIGDIKLVYPHYPEVENNDNLLPFFAAIMVILALIVTALTLPPPQEMPPLETPDNRINLQQQLHFSVNSVDQGLTSSIFS